MNSAYSYEVWRSLGYFPEMDFLRISSTPKCYEIFLSVLRGTSLESWEEFLQKPGRNFPRILRPNPPSRDCLQSAENDYHRFLKWFSHERFSYWLPYQTNLHNVISSFGRKVERCVRDELAYLGLKISLIHKKKHGYEQCHNRSKSRSLVLVTIPIRNKTKTLVASS